MQPIDTAAADHDGDSKVLDVGESFELVIDDKPAAVLLPAAAATANEAEIQPEVAPVALKASDDTSS